MAFRYKLSLRDLTEMFLQRGITFTHEAVREWESKLAPRLSKALRKRCHGSVGQAGTWTRPTDTLLKIARLFSCAVVIASS